MGAAGDPDGLCLWGTLGDPCLVPGPEDSDGLTLWGTLGVPCLVPVVGTLGGVVLVLKISDSS